MSYKTGRCFIDPQEIGPNIQNDSCQAVQDLLKDTLVEQKLDNTKTVLSASQVSLLSVPLPVHFRNTMHSLGSEVESCCFTVE